MKEKLKYHFGAQMRRIAFFLFFLISAGIIHKIFTYFNREVIGALIFILFFCANMIVYYRELFKNRKQMLRSEAISAVLFMIFCTIFMFAIIYAESIENSNDYFMKYGQASKITFGDAFYFSTATITTLGYGDIVPVGIFRLFVIIEVFMGILYTGTMIYFITEHDTDQIAERNKR